MKSLHWTVLTALLLGSFVEVSRTEELRAKQPGKEVAGVPLMGVRQIVAHRGSSADRPENTLASVRRAIEAGATATEVDIRTTADGQLVILHDATLDRTTTGHGPLTEATLADVRKLDAGTWFDERFRNERVPTLKEVLTLCRGRIDVLLDLKQQGEDFARAVAAEVRESGDPHRTIVGVRSVEQAKLFRRLLPEARQLALIPRPDDIEAFAAAGAETIRLWPRWLDDANTNKRNATLVQRVRDAGARLHLNGTTGERDEVLRLLEHRPESLSSDDPGRLVQTLAQLQSERVGARLPGRGQPPALPRGWDPKRAGDQVLERCVDPGETHLHSWLRPAVLGSFAARCAHVGRGSPRPARSLTGLGETRLRLRPAAYGSMLHAPGA